MIPVIMLAAAAPDAAPASTGELRTLICAAAAKGDKKLARSIAALAAEAHPASADEFNGLTSMIAANGKCVDAPAAKEPPSSADARKAAPDSIKGSLEFGLGQTNGPTNNANANIAAAVEAVNGGWSQRIRATLDYQDIEGIAAYERYTASWDLKRTLSKTAFVTGLATFESDHLAGFRMRTTQSFGFGAKVDLAQQMTLDLSGGPSWRQIEWLGARGNEDLLGARGSAALSWTIAPGVSFAATGSGIFEATRGTIEGQASLTGKVIGPLATRLQFTARHETRPFPGIEPTTTTSRASIVYNF